MGEHAYPLLDRVQSPADLRTMNVAELTQLAGELREFLIQSVSTRGGHFAAGLGTVELTVALHHVFATPEDRIVWDVGHQAYPHKVLTGRRSRLQSIKQAGGLAPFPNRAESQYDTFGTGHSSTSISAALGMAIASAHKGENRRAVAVIGDGAMTAGMAFEALNHAGTLPVNLLVVLNDNDMSISEGVGALSQYFARVLSGRIYSTLREGSGLVQFAKRFPDRDNGGRSSRILCRYGCLFDGKTQTPQAGPNLRAVQRVVHRRTIPAGRHREQDLRVRPGADLCRVPPWHLGDVSADRNGEIVFRADDREHAD